MTVGTKMHQTLTSLEGAIADLKTYALETQDKNAKKQFTDYANQIENIAQGLKGRVNYLETQEPQYKVFQQAQGKMQ
ncbi:hypothetical protein E308F_24590 [Moorella sp. E308F]|uniref:DUF1657 domain-containing protein n=1 Tax=unclassified Neomoorella TaxID=2676739 RepID=UPI0010FFB882|nr:MULTISPECIES: DUF1657 domain-containing protein [unclassified Moorella (in: firmicutes)]GEA16215.1 hypothetical protein E308F_24590 [Moorella sp. E308F]GEA18940.1 hypothetical protein E306M_20770 [Moorella sp. E306M]